MATESMYRLAFQYKETKLWRQLCDSEIFAVRLSDGETGYCCVMGMLNEHTALALYVGAMGFHTFRVLANAGVALLLTDEMELKTGQDCLQCAFEMKDMLDDDELREVRDYARQNGILLRGKNAYPRFVQYRPGRYPWTYESNLDNQRICEALTAAIQLSELLKTHSKEDLGLTPVRGEGQTVPMFVQRDGQLVLESTELPPEPDSPYPTPESISDITIARLRKLKKRGTYECALVRLRQPVLQEDEEEDDGGARTKPRAPYFPVVLLCVDSQSGEALQPSIMLDYDEDPGQLLQLFMDMLLSSRICPRVLKVRNERTLALVREMCEKLGILLSLEEDLPALEEVQEELFRSLEQAGDEDDEYDDEDEDFDEDDGDDSFSGMLGQMIEIYDMLMNLSDRELKMMPKVLVEQIFSLADEGMLPEELEKRMRRVFKR